MGRDPVLLTYIPTAYMQLWRSGGVGACFTMLFIYCIAHRLLACFFSCFFCGCSVATEWYNLAFEYVPPVILVIFLRLKR